MNFDICLTKQKLVFYCDNLNNDNSLQNYDRFSKYWRSDASLVKIIRDDFASDQALRILEIILLRQTIFWMIMNFVELNTPIIKQDNIEFLILKLS